MPLIKIPKKFEEEEFVYTPMDELAVNRTAMPIEQLRAANHSPDILELMVQGEERDAYPEKTRRDVYEAIEQRNMRKILASTKNISVAERTSLLKGYYVALSQRIKEEGDIPEANDISVFLQDQDMDLFDFMARLIELRRTPKKKKK